MSLASQFRHLVHTFKPLPVVGAINAYSGLMAKQVGFSALYLSGAGVANASFGLPDLGITNLTDVLMDAERIIDACQLPLLVDIDTGFGNIFGITRTIKTLERAQVAAVHMEDQVISKRCGHRPNKQLVTKEEMGDRIKAAVDARYAADFVIMARTDAYGIEGLQSAIERAQYYIDSGADMIFAEAMTSLDEYRIFCDAIKVPLLANITEFGKTPLFLQKDLAKAGVSLVLYPLSAFRAMSQAAMTVYQHIFDDGTQEKVLPLMQTRDELYEVLNYHKYEEQLDAILENEHG